MASALLAAILSLLIPGLGQFYAGHLFRAIGLFLLAIFIGILMGYLYPLFAIVAAIDAYFLAARS